MNLIFDFDGTICDSFGAIEKILKTNFPEIKYSNISTLKARELGIKELIKKSKIPKHKIPKILAVGRREMSKHVPFLITFPEMKSVLEKLSISNTLGILTSNSVKNVNLFLNKNKIDKYFNFVHSEITLFGKHKKLEKLLRKYSLTPEKTYYVGDETRDTEAAKKAGLKSVSVTWGFESEKLLQKSNPDIIINSPKELLNI
jgi:phosphoglycolate phosphatase